MSKYRVDEINENNEGTAILANLHSHITALFVAPCRDKNENNEGTAILANLHSHITALFVAPCREKIPPPLPLPSTFDDLQPPVLRRDKTTKQ